jgi:hypothetical protein
MTAPTLPLHRPAGLLCADLAWAVFDQIEENPERWDQDSYRNTHNQPHGPSHDFAGWVVTLNGDEWADDWHVLVKGEKVYVKQRAIQLLDLDAEQVWNLLDLEETDLERLRTRIVETFGEVA